MRKGQGMSPMPIWEVLSPSARKKEMRFFLKFKQRLYGYTAKT
jgi:hypothetical protein